MGTQTDRHPPPGFSLPPLFRSWWEIGGLGLLSLLVVIGGFWLAWQFVQPAPPQKVVLAAGTRGGAYWQFAESYRRTFENAGIELELRETAGAAENYALLLDPSSSVDAAIVQGGTAPPGAGARLLSVCAIDLEPLWVFHREQVPVARLRDLQGKRVAIGVPGSGTQITALSLLRILGIPEHGDRLPPATTGPGVELLPIGGMEALERLENGSIDAAFFVASTRSPLVMQAVSLPGVTLLATDRAEAIARVYPAVRAVKLAEGVLDLERNLPPRDLPMIAVTAGLAVRRDTHPAVVQLLVQAAKVTHRDGSAVTSPGEFPSSYFADLPDSDVATHELRMGPGWLQRHLPFWAASLISRVWVLALPFLTLVIPLARFWPVLVQWRARSRVYRWYKRVRLIDERTRVADVTTEDLRSARAELQRVHARVSELKVPLAHTDALYQLRMHIRFVDEGLEKRLAETR